MEEHDDKHDDKHDDAPKNAPSQRSRAKAPAPEAKRQTVNRWQLEQLRAEGNLQPSEKTQEELGEGFVGVLDGVDLYLE